MASPGNRHCAGCIGTLSFPVGLLLLVWRVGWMQKPCVSVSFEPSGRFIVVGTIVGRFIVLDSVAGTHVVSVQLGNDSLETLAFSPGPFTINQFIRQ